MRVFVEREDLKKSFVIYNSLTRKLEVFRPIREKEVRIYTCGPTVYDYPHIGHGRTYAVWDTLKRWLYHIGYDVYHVMNITDVGHLTSDMDFGEDKILKRALEKHMEPMVLVEKMTDAFFEQMNRINVEKPDLTPRASCHIPEIIEVVKKIIENGYAYVVNGSVYLDIERYMKDYPYPEFVDMDLSELEKVHRIEPLPEKKNKWDFALWKRAPPGHILQWPSPWGYGFPGWHIECTVMSAKYLGEEFDIHGGGEDHKFPHHPNERAQAFAAFGKGLARYWMHTGFVKINGEKMSKSTGNFVYLHEAIDKYGGDVVRFWAISSHYRRQVDYTDDALEAAKNALDSLYLFVQDLEEAGGGEREDPYREEFVRSFETAMNNDLDTVNAVKALFELRSRWYSENLFDKVSEEEARKTYEAVVYYGGILGLQLDARTQRRKLLEKHAYELLKTLVDLREDLRKEKLFKFSDEIREKLREIGIELMDTPKGTKVRFRG